MTIDQMRLASYEEDAKHELREAQDKDCAGPVPVWAGDLLELVDVYRTLQARCAELETALLHESTVKGRVAELEKDAARYRWLRGDAPPHSERWSRWDIQRWEGGFFNPLERETLDAAIDAAIEGKL